MNINELSILIRQRQTNERHEAKKKIKNRKDNRISRSFLNFVHIFTTNRNNRIYLSSLCICVHVVQYNHHPSLCNNFKERNAR